MRFRLADVFNVAYHIRMTNLLDDLPKTLGFGRIVLRYDAEDDQQFDPADDEEEGDFIRHRYAAVIGQTVDEHHKVIAETHLGHIRGAVFLLDSAMNAGEDIVDIADGCNQILYEAAEVLHGIHEKKDQLINNLFGGVGLYIHEMFLRPEYRGHNLGRYALQRFIDRHDAASILAVVLYPNATYFDHAANKDPLADVEPKLAQRKLEAHYRSMGFKKVPRTGSLRKYMWLSADDIDSRWPWRAPTKDREPQEPHTPNPNLH